MARQLTITLDDVAERLEEKRSADSAIDAAVNAAANDALRRVLNEAAPPTRRKFVVRTFDMGKPRVDLDCAWRLRDEHKQQ